MTTPDIKHTRERRGRAVENAGFYVALFVGALYAISETITHIGVSFGSGEHSEKFPWGVLIMVVTFSLPKILGRATAGKIWGKVADTLPGGKD